MTLITNEMWWEGKERNVETTVYNTKRVGIALRSERVGDGMRWGKKKKNQIENESPVSAVVIYHLCAYDESSSLEKSVVVFKMMYSTVVFLAFISKRSRDESWSRNKVGPNTTARFFAVIKFSSDCSLTLKTKKRRSARARLCGRWKINKYRNVLTCSNAWIELWGYRSLQQVTVQIRSWTFALSHRLAPYLKVEISSVNFWFPRRDDVDHL